MPLKFIIPVNGVMFEGRQKVLARLQGKEEHTVELVLEPENKYDEHAVKVVMDDKHIGYIPKEISHEISLLIQRKEIIDVDVYQLGSFKEGDDVIYFLEIEIMLKGTEIERNQ